MNLTVNTNLMPTDAATEHREPEQQSTRSDSSRCSSPSSSSSSSSSSPGRTRRGGRGGRGRNRRNRQPSPRSVAASSSSSPSSFCFGSDDVPQSSPSPTHLAKYSRRANPLVPPSPPHDAPMTKADIYFAMDCEMVGVGSDGTSNALARVVLVNYDEDVVYDKFVRVSQPVTDYRTFVSGITADDLEGNPAAISFAECRAEVRRILHGKILIGHGLSSDLAALDMSHPWSDVRDTAKYAPFMRHVHSRDTHQDVLLPSKLRDLVWDRCQMQIQHLGQSHDPKEDAVAALRLYKSARKEWEVDMIRQVKAARELEEATVRRAARRQQRVQQRVRQRQQQQQQHQHQYMMQVMSSQYGKHNNMNMSVNVNVKMNMATNCKPSVNTVHQSGGRPLSPQLMPVHAPTMSPPPLMMQPPMQTQPLMHVAHPPGLGLPAMDHGYQYKYQHQHQGQRNANNNSGAGAYPCHRLQARA